MGRPIYRTPRNALEGSVIVCVVLAGFFGMMSGVNQMAMRHVGVMTGLLGIAGFMMFRGASVVGSGVLVMLGGFTMVFCGLLRHGVPPGRAYRPGVSWQSQTRD